MFFPVFLNREVDVSIKTSILRGDIFSAKKSLIRFCILIPGSFGDVLGIENKFVSIEKSKCYAFLQKMFDPKIDVLIEKSISL